MAIERVVAAHALEGGRVLRFDEGKLGMVDFSNHSTRMRLKASDEGKLGMVDFSNASLSLVSSRADEGKLGMVDFSNWTQRDD